jgi:hypothetical protein
MRMLSPLSHPWRSCHICYRVTAKCFELLLHLAGSVFLFACLCLNTFGHLLSSTSDVLVVRLLQPPSPSPAYEHEDLKCQNDDKQDSVKINGHDFTPKGLFAILRTIGDELILADFLCTATISCSTK